MKVMVVDDDDSHREAIGMLLETRGDAVQTFGDASRALEALRANALPDAIVLDLMMPNMDGWEFRLIQKHDPRLASVPVIAMSGLNTPQAAAMDADAFLRKPVDASQLLQTLDHVVAQRRQQEERARAGELERLVSLGALLGGIAHEINNPLAIAIGSIDMARAKFGRLADRMSAEEDRTAFAASMRALDTARRGAERVNAVVRSASFFATADLDRIDLINVREVLESSLQIVSNEIRHSARLERELSAVPPVRGNGARLGQVFLNLLLNAVAAIRESRDPGHSIRVVLAHVGDEVVVSVSDTATCLEDDGSGSLLDPLRSSRREGARLRFGLAVSRELLDAMHGRLEAERNPPHGATYRATLPVHRDHAEGAHVATGAEACPQPRNVLIIDDEPLMCHVLQTMLADCYEVTTFNSAPEALADLLQHDYGAVLCDMMMPELDGAELFEQVVRARPELRARFVFMTGGAFTRQAQQFLAQCGRPVLSKPCTRPALLETLAKVVGAPERTVEPVLEAQS